MVLGMAATAQSADTGAPYNNFGYEGQIAAGSRFESNVDHLGFGFQPDIVTSLAPKLSLTYTRPRLLLRSDATYGWQHYVGLPTDAAAYDRHTLELREGTELSFATGLRLSGDYTFLRSDDVAYNDFEGGSGYVVGRYRHQGRLLAGQSFGGSRSDTEVEYYFYKEGYRSKRLQVLDRYTHAAQVRTRFQLRPKTALFGMLAVIGNIPVDKALYPYSDRSINISLRPGIRTQWTRKIGFSVAAGVSAWVFDTTGHVRPVVLADIDYRPTALAQVTLTYEFTTKDSVTSSYFDLSRVVLALDRRLSRSWDSTASLDYSWIRFGPPFVRTDHLIKPRAGITYQPVQMPYLEAGLQYGYERRFAPEVYADILRGRPLSLAGHNHSLGLDVTWSF